jgi:hypothetical protein
MAKTLLRHARGILSYYRTKLTSAKVEGINRKIRGLLAAAYGITDSDFSNSAFMHFTKLNGNSSVSFLGMPKLSGRGRIF